MRPAMAILPAVMFAVAGCSTPEVEAELRQDCGPLDGLAFTIMIPDGDDTIRAYGPNWPDRGEGRYEIAPSSAMEPVSISLCPADGSRCEQASYGSFAVTPQEDSGFAGTLQAVFPESGSRRLAFTAYEDEDYEPPMCG